MNTLLRIGGLDVYILDLTPEEYILPYIAGYVIDPGPGERLVVVETGPRCCVSPLLRLLDRLDAENRGVDIYVTHVHLDHAGAAGLIAAKLASARIYAHPRGAPHLVNPAKLWRASLDFLGPIARLYQEPHAAPGDRVEATLDGMEKSYGAARLTVVHTPGHASHHQSILVEAGGERLLFPGDSAGIAAPFVDAVVPTTPPPFKLDMYRESLEKQTRLDPSIVLYTHMGPGGPDLLTRHARQLPVWLEAALETLEEGGGADEMLEKLRGRDPETRLFLEAAAGSKLLVEAVKHSAMGFLDYARRLSSSRRR